MPKELYIKFIIVCSICAALGGVWNAFHYYYTHFLHDNLSKMTGNERRVEHERLMLRSVIFGIQSWFWIISLILICFLATYPIFHELK